MLFDLNLTLSVKTWFPCTSKTLPIIFGSQQLESSAILQPRQLYRTCLVCVMQICLPQELSRRWILSARQSTAFKLPTDRIHPKVYLTATSLPLCLIGYPKGQYVARRLAQICLVCDQLDMSQIRHAIVSRHLVHAQLLHCQTLWVVYPMCHRLMGY
jgi:hypothetical protein